jgi:hypothetical protein
MAHHAQVLAGFHRGRLVEVEEHWTHWNTCCEAPDYLQNRSAAAILRGYASLNSWMLGRADSARKRIADMIAFARAPQRRTLTMLSGQDILKASSITF